MGQFKQLRVWQAAAQQLKLTVEVTRQLRLGDLANQMRRAALSVPSNIAEGRGRRSDREFARFLDIARSSNDELACQLELALTVGCVDQARGEAILRINGQVGRMLTCLLARLAAGD